MYLKENTFDDLMRGSSAYILKEGIDVLPTKGKAKEIFGAFLELNNPLARLSRTKTKGKLFSCLGEFLWYLSGSNDLDFVQYYIPYYNRFSDDQKTLYGAYGPRLLNQRGLDQLGNLKARLAKNPSSRRGVIQIFNAEDLPATTEDPPCTCTLQFAIREGRLHMMTHMRSNDAFIGMQHDFFAFTMLQEMLAIDLDVGLGTYKHSVGSLHIYEDDLSNVQTYLNEGWQSTQVMMPAMPKQQRMDAIIPPLLNAEQEIRLGARQDLKGISLPEYWMDVVRLLLVFQKIKKKNTSAVEQLANEMTSSFYKVYLNDRLDRLQVKASEIAVKG